MDWYIQVIDDKPFLCFTFTNECLAIWYKNKAVMERMTKTYLPSKEEMIKVYPHLEEIL